MDGPGVPSNDIEVSHPKLISFIQHVNGKHLDLTLWLAGQMCTNTVIKNATTAFSLTTPTHTSKYAFWHSILHFDYQICQANFLFLLTRGPMTHLQKIWEKAFQANHTNEISHLLRCQSKHRIQKNVKCATNQHCFCRIIRTIFIQGGFFLFCFCFLGGV